MRLAFCLYISKFDSFSDTCRGKILLDLNFLERTSFNIIRTIIEVKNAFIHSPEVAHLERQVNNTPKLLTNLFQFEATLESIISGHKIDGSRTRGRLPTLVS